jgi:hypothetical protein
MGDALSGWSESEMRETAFGRVAKFYSCSFGSDRACSAKDLQSNSIKSWRSLSNSKFLNSWTTSFQNIVQTEHRRGPAYKNAGFARRVAACASGSQRRRGEQPTVQTCGTLLFRQVYALTKSSLLC